MTQVFAVFFFRRIKRLTYNPGDDSIVKVTGCSSEILNKAPAPKKTNLGVARALLYLTPKLKKPL